ncbi:MAG: hypothetical protein QOF42_1050 [Gammaproteobacteria bacterium]|jgi:hypothetical protein|nr:hypothetical protein [Gammaproteobacteria bacterium]
MVPVKNNTASSACTLACLYLAASPILAQTPEQEKLWAAQRAQHQAEENAKAEQLLRQREARKADPMAWVRTLQPMTEGGWQFRGVAPDGSWAAFSTEHQMKRSGHSVTVWLRQEYPEAQRSDDGDIYLSNVEKIEYNCAKERARALLVIYYSENNIGGTQKTEENDPKQASWDPIVPGTQGESIYRWACASGAKSR